MYIKPAAVALLVLYPFVIGEVIGSILGTNRFICKDVKNDYYE